MTTFARNAAVATFAAFSLFSQSAFAQKDMRIAVVDVQTVVAGLPDYQSATTKLQGFQTTYQDSMKAMQSRYQATADTYDKLGSTVSDDTKKKEATDLQMQRDAMSKFQEDQQTQYQQTQQALMKPIMDKMTNTLEAFAKKEHYTMILPKTAPVYSDPTLDVTPKFQDFLKTAQ